MKRTFCIALALVLCGIVNALENSPGSKKESRRPLLYGEGRLLFFSDTWHNEDNPIAPLVSMPFTVGREKTPCAQKWKELFKWARSCCNNVHIGKAMDDVINEYLKVGYSEECFFKKALVKLEQFVQKLNIEEFNVPRRKVTLRSTISCACCLGDYHIETSEKDCIGVRHFRVCTELDDDRECFLEKIIISKPHLSQLCMPTHSEKKSQAYEDAMYEMRKKINVISHELIHVVRKDGIIKRAGGWGYDAKKSLSHAIEFQADAISQLLIQDEAYFMACAEVICNSYVNQPEEVDIIRSKYAPNNGLLLKRAFEAFKRAAFPQEVHEPLAEILRSLPEESQYSIIKGSAEEFYKESYSDTHPYGHQRLQRILTMWAAYLVHDQSWRYDTAICHVCRTMNGAIMRWSYSPEYQKLIHIAQIPINEWAKDALSQGSKSSRPVKILGKKRKRIQR